MNFFLMFICGILLSACGPLHGQFLRLSEGVKSYEVIQGRITDLNKVNNLLIVGPFLGARNGHHMCLPGDRGVFPDNSRIIFITRLNDAQRFAEGFKEAGIFDPELLLEVYYDRIEGKIRLLRTMSGPEIKQKFGLREVPEIILFGTVKKLEHKIAQLRGVEVDVSYELEFYNLETRQSVVIEVEVVELFGQDLRTIIKETKARLAEGGN